MADDTAVPGTAGNTKSDREAIATQLMLACLPAMPAAVTCAQAAEDTSIAFAATITAGPETVPGSVLRLVDGSVRTTLVFEVGTEGGGVITFAFDTPRLVFGVRFYQSSGIYCATRHAIEADTDGDGEFDRVLAEGAQTPLQAWVEHRWAPVVLRALCFRAVEGVSEGRRAQPVMAESQVPGKPEDDDMERAAAAGVARFLEVVGAGEVPYLVESGPDPAVSEAEEARIAVRAPNPTFCDFTMHANSYLQTGSEAYARKVIETL